MKRLFGFVPVRHAVMLPGYGPGAAPPIRRDQTPHVRVRLRISLRAAGRQIAFALGQFRLPDGHTLEMQLPSTDPIWFIKAPFERVVTETTEWLNGLGGRSFTRLREPLPSMLHHLEPWAMPSWKQLMVSTSANQWTALFTQGSDIGTANVVGARLDCLNIRTSHQPHINHDGKIVTYGSTTLWIHSGARHLRSIQESYQSRWLWTLFGDPQPFENLDKYTAKKIPDRAEGI